jgi:hypothetical protein
MRNAEATNPLDLRALCDAGGLFIDVEHEPYN